MDKDEKKVSACPCFYHTLNSSYIFYTAPKRDISKELNDMFVSTARYNVKIVTPSKMFSHGK